MTTATKQALRVDSGSRVLFSAAVAALLVGSGLAAVGAVVEGSAAAYGAAVGAGIAAAVFLLGSLLVNVVAGLAPSASLLVALLTYALQVVLMAVVFAALSRASAFSEPTARVWLAASVIAATVTWMVAHIWFATRQRIPLYDLSSCQGPSAGTRGER